MSQSASQFPDIEFILSRTSAILRLTGMNNLGKTSVRLNCANEPSFSNRNNNNSSIFSSESSNDQNNDIDKSLNDVQALRGLKITALNVNSLCKHIDELRIILRNRPLDIFIINKKHNYCCEVWVNTNEGQTDKLQRVQNRAARIITETTYEITSKDVLDSLGWEPLKQRRDVSVATHYHTVPYHTIPYHTIPYRTIPYHTIPYHTIPYHTIPYHTSVP